MISCQRRGYTEDFICIILHHHVYSDQIVLILQWYFIFFLSLKKYFAIIYKRPKPRMIELTISVSYNKFPFAIELLAAFDSQKEHFHSAIIMT